MNRSPYLVVSVATTGSLLLLGSSHLSGLVHRSGGSLDVLLGGNSHQVAWDVHELLADGDVSLSDEHSGVMDRVGVLSLRDEGLESPLKHLRYVQSQYVIELSLGFLQETESHHPSDKCFSYS